MASVSSESNKLLNDLSESKNGSISQSIDTDPGVQALVENTKSDNSHDKNIEAVKQRFPEASDNVNAQSKDRERYSDDAKGPQSISTRDVLMTENLESQHLVSRTRQNQKEFLGEEAHIPVNFEYSNNNTAQTHAPRKITESFDKKDDSKEEKDTSRHSPIIRLQAVLNEVQSSSTQSKSPKRKVLHLNRKTDKISIKSSNHSLNISGLKDIPLDNNDNTSQMSGKNTILIENMNMIKRDATKRHEINPTSKQNINEPVERTRNHLTEGIGNSKPATSINHTSKTNNSQQNFVVHNLSSIVWKHRSGVQGHAIKNKQKAWERRRLVLAGTKLLYYDLTAKDIAESMGAIVGDVQISPRVGTYNENQAFGARGMVNLLRPGSQVTPVTSFKNEVESELRAPTSFGMEVLVGDIKWKFCFDTVQQQAQWISSLNDVVYRMKFFAEKEYQSKMMQQQEYVNRVKPAGKIYVDNHCSETTISKSSYQPNTISSASGHTHDVVSQKNQRQHSLKKENNSNVSRSKLESHIWSEVSAVRPLEQKQFLLRESNSRYLLGKAQLMNGNYEQAKAAFEKTLESRTILFGPNDPEIAEVYEALGDVAAEECDGKRAQEYYQQSVDIIKKCKRKLDSIPSLVMEKGSGQFKEDLDNENSAQLDIALQKVERKLKNISECITPSSEKANDDKNNDDDDDDDSVDVRTKAYAKEIAKLEKVLENRLEAFGPTDPEVASVYEMMGDAAIKYETDTAPADINYTKSLDILLHCKSSIIKEFNASGRSDDIKLQPNYMRVDVAEKRLKDKLDNLYQIQDSDNLSTEQQEGDYHSNKQHQQQRNMYDQSMKKIDQLNQELRRKNILSKIAVEMKEQLKEVVREKDLVISSLRNEMEERNRRSIGLEEEVRALRFKLTATQKLLEAREEELCKKDETIQFLMSNLEVSKKQQNPREF